MLKEERYFKDSSMKKNRNENAMYGAVTKMPIWVYHFSSCQ